MKTYLPKIGMLFSAIFITSCSMFIPKDENMKWTAQYNFMDLYKKRNHGFNPGSDKQLSLVFSPMENVIILGAL